MAETAIYVALKVLGDALVGEFVKLAAKQFTSTCSTFENLEASMNNIYSELQVMQAFLDQMDVHNQRNYPQVAWLKEVQNLAFRIEDIVFEFMYLVGKHKFSGIFFRMKKILIEPKSLVAMKRIGTQLLEVEKTIKQLAEIKERWVPTTYVRIDNNLNYSDEYSQNIAISAHFIDEDQIVGIKENRMKLTSWLNSKDPELSIISIWGMGGVGKTTLVTNVFNREEINFDCHAWINVSQSYTMENLLQNIISEICTKEKNNLIDTCNMDLRGLKEIVRDLLREKKYLIVLDDMWDPKAFQDICDILINNHRESRIMITSRILEVTFLAPKNNRLELKPLPKLESWDLFCRKAFHNEKNHECPPLLEKWAREIVLKCDGLPLALVSLGSVLSCSERTEYAWRRVHDQLTWELDNNPSLNHLKNILNLSFKYLPKYLKNCFLYCSLFPEDFLLSRKKLLRLWIAEGFIEHRGRSTLEEVAEEYLQELIHRSMLQVVKKNAWGRVKRCRMHDTLRELAICLCREKNFGLLQEDSNTTNVNNYIRRLSVVKLREEISHDVNLPQLRTFMSFNPTVPSYLLMPLILDKSRYLAVLNLEGQAIKMITDTIGDLFNLRYLGLRATEVKFLPKSIEKLNNLQTLDLMHSKIQKLPDGIAKLKNLRHLFAQVQVDTTYRTFRALAGISLPKGIFYLKELQTLQTLESNAIIVRELGNLTQLRSFRIVNVKENHSAELCRSLSKMSSLSYLSIFASNENELLQLEGLNLSQIQKLCLFGRLKEQMLKSPLFQNSGEAINMLKLGWSELQKDPLPSLFHLKNITWLHLQKAYKGRKLNFKSKWFPKLKYLILRQMPNLVEVEMEQGTMVILEIISLSELEQLVEIPKGIEHLVNLKRMVFQKMPAGYGGLASGIHQLFHFTCDVL